MGARMQAASCSGIVAKSFPIRFTRYGVSHERRWCPCAMPHAARLTASRSQAHTPSGELRAFPGRSARLLRWTLHRCVIVVLLSCMHDTSCRHNVQRGDLQAPPRLYGTSSDAGRARWPLPRLANAGWALGRMPR